MYNAIPKAQSFAETYPGFNFIGKETLSADIEKESSKVKINHQCEGMSGPAQIELQFSNRSFEKQWIKCGCCGMKVDVCKLADGRIVFLKPEDQIEL